MQAGEDGLAAAGRWIPLSMLLISGLDLGQRRYCLPTDLMRGTHEENQNAERTTRGRTHVGCGASNSRDEDQVERVAGAADEYDSGESPVLASKTIQRRKKVSFK